MTVLALTAAGWCLAATLGVAVVRQRRRLELVAAAEHELRGPLTALALALESSPALRRRELHEAQLDRLRLGLDDLAAARDGRRARGPRSLVPLERVVWSAAAAWRPVARRSGRALAVDWRAGPVRVSADRRRLSQALGNLLANAVEHGDGRVELRGERSAGGVRVEVRDGGTGFGGRGKTRRASGRGRGLGIAARAAEDAGGRLSVAPVEGGAAVALELPVTDP